MKYEYSNNCSASKTIKAKEIPKLPNDVILNFSTAHIRIYKADIEDCFYCNLAIPAFKDDEGYVLELGVLGNSDYEFSLNNNTFDTLTESIECYFEDKTEEGQRMILLRIRIKGTAFDGYALLDSELYEINNFR